MLQTLRKGWSEKQQENKLYNIKTLNLQEKVIILVVQESSVAYFASVYMDGVEYRASTRPF